MRSLPLLLAVALFVPLACSSDETGGGSGTNTPFEPPGNGVPMLEKEACETVRDAEGDAWLALGCGPLTQPACPDYLKKGQEACLQWDQGTVLGCAAYISALGSCDALKSSECIVKPLPGTAPAGCPAPSDGGIDAPVDTGADAPADTGGDAPADAGFDAVVDSGVDAASDAAADASQD